MTAVVRRKSVRRSEGGFSLVEAAVALVILGILLAAVLPYLTSRPMNLRADTNDLVANLRLARDLAISRTTHYRVRVVDRESYALERLDESTGQWVEERTVRLRENVQFARTTRNNQIAEFDSRGRIPQSWNTVLLPFTLEDPVRREQRSVRVSNAGGV
ncbi:MAG: Tfp pilus assembly protein FimT/FimU [bacterium]